MFFPFKIMKIPYYKNNQLVKDIAMASQGERSIASLALSFALSCQNLSKYNIMLLDELDSTLDTNNRKLFIKILEKQKFRSFRVYLLNCLTICIPARQEARNLS
jgi:DNA repair exonuclease SbcCD ATPase subunit